MRLEVKDGKIVCTADDWKALSHAEKKVVGEYYFNYLSNGHNENGDIVLCDIPQEKEDDYRLFIRITAIAGCQGVECSEEVENLCKQADNFFKLKHEEKQREEQRRLRKTMWEGVKREGCGSCQNCSIVADVAKCLHSGDTLHTTFFEKYDYKTKDFIFQETGKPNEHCKYYAGA